MPYLILNELYEIFTIVDFKASYICTDILTTGKVSHINILLKFE